MMPLPLLLWLGPHPLPVGLWRSRLCEMERRRGCSFILQKITDHSQNQDQASAASLTGRGPRTSSMTARISCCFSSSKRDSASSTQAARTAGLSGRRLMIMMVSPLVRSYSRSLSTRRLMLVASYVMGRWLRGSGCVRSWSITCVRVSFWVVSLGFFIFVQRQDEASGRTSLMTVWRLLGTCLFLSGSLAFCCSFRRC